MSENLMLCPKCGARMLRRGTGMMLASNPPQYPLEWHCGCGHREPGGREWGKTAEQLFHEDWKRENQADTGALVHENQGLKARVAELERERDEARAAAQRFVDRNIDWTDGGNTDEFARSLPWLKVYRGEREKESPPSC
jgi:hypothetical protein